MPFRYQRLLLFSSSENVILLQLNPVTLLDLDIVLHLNNLFGHGHANIPVYLSLCKDSGLRSHVKFLT
uniref:Uncharacterized protein n=1 Tax=Wuchereria bancrofti TaxID=6293 RepID=A0AAF5PM43_WUCBA